MLHIVKPEFETTSRSRTYLKVVDQISLLTTEDHRTHVEGNNEMKLREKEKSSSATRLREEQEAQLARRYQQQIKNKEYCSYARPSKYLPVMLLSPDEEKDFITSTFRSATFDVRKNENKQQRDSMLSSSSTSTVEFNPSTQQKIFAVKKSMDEAATSTTTKDQQQQQQQQHNDDAESNSFQQVWYILLKNKQVDEEVKKTATFTNSHTPSPADYAGRYRPPRHNNDDSDSDEMGMGLFGSSSDSDDMGVSLF